MQVTAGTRLGPYEIVSLLGAGGMGEVYRARDTRLDRSVALKVLPARVSATTLARERFEREARAISALQHPNICTLFDVGSSDGTEFLVMELLDGEPLSERLAKGPLPLDQVLRIGACIADALAKAHRAGIVHRDLKPANVMLTKSGPKLLDFGLARRATESQPIVGSDAPTAAERPLTSDGMILGTLPYMAPEQLESKPADARTDVFALGAVLYEMVTGRRAFQAQSQASLITKIMSEQPPPIESLQPVTPAALNRLVVKCLAKDPDERWQSAADVADELRWIAAAPATGAVAAKQRKPYAWIAAALCALAAIGLAIALLRRPVPAARVVRFDIDPPPHTTFAMTSTSRFLAVSPDGALVAYTANDGRKPVIYLRDLTRGTEKALEGTDNASALFWSPDGRSLGFVAGPNLKAVTVETGDLQTICDITPGHVSAAWLGDGTIVYNVLAVTRGFVAVPRGGGTARMLEGLMPPGAFGVASPCAIGGTHSFFFSVIRDHRPELWIGSIDGGAPRKLMENVSRATYVAPYLLFVRDGTLYVQRFDESALAVRGDAAPLADGLWFYKPVASVQLDAGGDTLVYSPAAFTTAVRWIDRDGHDAGEAFPPGPYRADISISADGKRALLAFNDLRTFISDVWLADLQRKTLARLTYGDHDYTAPVFSPDGTQMAFDADVGGPPHVMVRAIGGGPARAVSHLRTIQFTDAWLRDGRILYSSSESRTGSDIFITNANGTADQPWLQTPADEGAARVSPDERYVAYQSNATGRFEVYVEPLDHRGDRVRVSDGGGRTPAWSADGREIYFAVGRDLYASRVKSGGTSLDVEAPVRFYTAPLEISAIAVAPDGRILLSEREAQQATEPLRATIGWREEAERLLAAKK